MWKPFKLHTVLQNVHSMLPDSFHGSSNHLTVLFCSTDFCFSFLLQCRVLHIDYWLLKARHIHMHIIIIIIIPSSRHRHCPSLHADEVLSEIPRAPSYVETSLSSLVVAYLADRCLPPATYKHWPHYNRLNVSISKVYIVPYSQVKLTPVS